MCGLFLFRLIPRTQRNDDRRVGTGRGQLFPIERMLFEKGCDQSMIPRTGRKFWLVRQDRRGHLHAIFFLQNEIFFRGKGGARQEFLVARLWTAAALQCVQNSLFHVKGG